MGSNLGDFMLIALRRIYALAGINANIGWTLLARLAAMVAGVLIIFPIATLLSPMEQGYYFTFSSITGIQVLFELGMTQILVQVTSHEFAFLPARQGRSNDAGNVLPAQRLAYFAGFAHRWYLQISLIFGTVCAIGGLIFFWRFGNLPATYWALPWVALSVLTSVNLFLSPRLAFVEGAGFPGKIAALKFSQTVIGYTAMAALLLLGAGLWAAVALPATQMATSTAWLLRDTSVFNFFHPRVRDRRSRPEWRGELLGLQWRVALSWVGGYLSITTLMPLLFAYQGEVEAGKWGLTFSVFSQVSALGLSWITAQTPKLAALVARGERAALDREFFDASLKSTLLSAMACLALFAMIAGTRYFGIALSARLLDLPSAAMIGVATTALGLVYCFVVYVRAHKEEPLVASSLVIGALTTAAAFVASHFGTVYVALSYMLVSAGVNLPWRWAIFRRYRARGPAAPAPEPVSGTGLDGASA